MPSILISGANRGLGLGLTRLYAADGWRVLAGCREPENSSSLQALAGTSQGRVTLHRLDLEDHGSIERLAAELDGQPLDVLLNNAGFSSTKSRDMGSFGETDYQEWDRVFRVNVAGTMKMIETFVDNVAASTEKKVVSMSSFMGSIANNNLGHRYAYRASKSALNAIMKGLSVDLKPRGVIAVPLHPGWVKTDMGGPEAPMDIDSSVTGVKKVIGGLTLADSGKFLAYDGGVLPW